MCRSTGMSVTNRVGVEDANWLLSLAELPHLEKMVPLAGGWDNTNFLLHLADGSKVVLKAWFANRVEEVHRVILRHIHLDSHGIPTTVPIKLYDDRSFAEKNGFAWTLLPYIQGGHLGKDSQSLVSLGKELARMHEIPVSECFPREYRMGFTLFDQVASLSKDGGPDVSFVRLLASESSAIKSNLPKEIPIGVLHGDLFPDNIIGKGGVRAILDLEEAWIGPKILPWHSLDLAGKEQSRYLRDGSPWLEVIKVSEYSAIRRLRRFQQCTDMRLFQLLVGVIGSII